MHRVEPFGGEQENAELTAIHAVPDRLGDVGATEVGGWVGGDTAVDVSEAVEAAHRGQPLIDGGRCQAQGYRPRPVQLDVGAGGVEHGHVVHSHPAKKPRRS